MEESLGRGCKSGPGGMIVHQAVLLDEQNRAVAPGFAGSSQCSLATPIGRVFARLRRCLVPGNGYWLSSEKERALRYNDYTWYLHEGWNLIGWR